MRIDRTTPVLQEIVQGTSMVEMRVSEDDCGRRFAEVALRPPSDSSRRSRQPGVDEYPATSARDREHVHEEDAESHDPGGYRIERHDLFFRNLQRFHESSPRQQWRVDASAGPRTRELSAAGL